MILSHKSFFVKKTQSPAALRTAPEDCVLVQISLRNVICTLLRLFYFAESKIYTGTQGGMFVYFHCLETTFHSN